MQIIDKDRPSPELIASMRKRFEVEREVDRALTYKMEKRSGPAYTKLPLETLVAGLKSLIASQLKEPFEISNAHWLAGGASKLQVGFDLAWNRPGVGRETTRMVLRNDLAEALHATSRLREFQIVKALTGTIPMPPVFWVDNTGEHLPYPAIVYGFVNGVTKPSNAKSGVTGLGTYLPEDVRNKLSPQFVAHMAKMHTFDFSKAELSAFDVPQLGKQNAEWVVNWWDRVWAEDAQEEVPLMALASSWLHKNAPAVEHLSIVHGDFRTGNYLFNEADTRITTWLDWELSRIGDRHQDLAWSTSHAFSVLGEDGKTLLVSGLMPETQFLEEYEKASGLKVDKKALHYYQVFNAYSMIGMTLGTSYRVARNGKSHQDILLAWLLGVGYMLLDEMRGLIEKGV
ncbi:MAG: Acyl-CoA dehydrogenase protein [Hydrocarboniphaga sp.]|uniref:phosphotransferase family protein n=1 Tax=Hydrocarboniphaga sp. TaxID=2033016 RepID=UPI0026076A0F|nr:phosphotransferase family protein [Hydrocarboniphaga sp.]MDB5970312.1 Acyl-CoA dehydrogenase protein [Hydrocarboniphaga sp.]